MTGDAAAKAIRRGDPGGSLLLIGEEAVAPYKRPPLSKGLWKGGDEAKVDLGTLARGGDVRLGTRATGLDLAHRTLTLADGTEVGYERLLLATGARARELPGLPSGGPVVAFRHLTDYHVARARSGPGRVAAVIGGGFIGAELAAALTQAGTEVHMVFPEAELGANRFPAELAARIGANYRARGVTLHRNMRVASAKVTDAAATLTLDDGTTVRADLVVVGIGAVPNDQLAKAAGLRVDDGIWVDDRLRAARAGDDDRDGSALGVYAAGDVANFAFPGFVRRTRIEHEDNAYAMGAAAGRQMVASVTGAESAPFSHLPFFYSDLFDDGYEAVGALDARLDVVADWLEPGRSGVFYYLDGGTVRGVLLWNTWGLVDAARDLILADATVAPSELKGRLQG
ncbi:MAG: FAD-dependent oxidoreductase [Trueperaceae bacterium]|nr:FAD-dependent oxidoreductase [Trueperaceae bacterium]